MFTINRKQLRYLLFLVLLISFMPVFSSAHIQVEKTSEKWIKKVTLKKNARTNGFKITQRSGKIYFAAVKVTDPNTKKLVEGETQLEYRCEGGLITVVKVFLSNGNSASIQVSCMDLISPQIIIMEEEEQI
ncbi:MAG TPA: hypothetical protein VN451_11565 [Chitinophagaceae bacterium]|nr:hypothetical protein [Chitinophagaceae bacterium]